MNIVLKVSLLLIFRVFKIKPGESITKISLICNLIKSRVVFLLLLIVVLVNLESKASKILFIKVLLPELVSPKM